jgi:hypothetical protein
MNSSTKPINGTQPFAGKIFFSVTIVLFSIFLLPWDYLTPSHFSHNNLFEFNALLSCSLRWQLDEHDFRALLSVFDSRISTLCVRNPQPLAFVGNSKQNATSSPTRRTDKILAVQTDAVGSSCGPHAKPQQKATINQFRLCRSWGAHRIMECGESEKETEARIQCCVADRKSVRVISQNQR